MNITTERDQEIGHELQEPGAYEWWYFDAEDAGQEISLVLIWFDGFAFSPYYMEHYLDWKENTGRQSPVPREYAGFSFQLYHHGRELVNYIREGGGDLFDSSSSQVEIRFENNLFVFDRLLDEYRLTVDFNFPARHKRVKATLVFRPEHRFSFTKEDGNAPGSQYHQWFPSVPKAAVSGTVTISDMTGDGSQFYSIRARGYHDHNLGTMPMHEYIAKWYWGRAFSERFDLVYYVIFFRNNGSAPLAVVMLHDNDDNSQSIMDRVSFEESNYTRGFFSPLHGRRLSLKQGDIGVEVEQETVLDAGPFYLRFESNLSLSIGGERVTGVKGISEFLNPAPLQSRMMRYFTRSRVSRDGEQSAIYKQYNFFKNHFDWFNKKIF